MKKMNPWTLMCEMDGQSEFAQKAPQIGLYVHWNLYKADTIRSQKSDALWRCPLDRMFP